MLRPVEVPVPNPGPGEVLVRVEAAAVNYSDVMRRRASPYPFPTALPYVPGSEVSGSVAALGEGVAGPPVGARVLALVGQGGEGGYAQFAIAAASRVIPVPAGIDLHVAASLLVAGTTAVLLLTEGARLREGERLFVPAATGGVGSIVVQLAKRLGAGRIVAGVGGEGKRRRALALGADVAVDYTRPGWQAQAGEVDVAIEMRGGAAIEETLGLLAPFGRLVVSGSAGGEPHHLGPDALQRWLAAPALGQTVTAFNLGAFFGLRPEIAGRALGHLLERVVAGQIEVPIGRVLPLVHAVEAHRALEARETTGKIVLEPWGA